MKYEEKAPFGQAVLHRAQALRGTDLAGSPASPSAGAGAGAEEAGSPQGNFIWSFCKGILDMGHV